VPSILNVEPKGGSFNCSYAEQVEVWFQPHTPDREAPTIFLRLTDPAAHAVMKFQTILSVSRSSGEILHVDYS